MALRRVAGLYRDSFSGLPREAWLFSLVMLVNRAGTMVLPFLALWFTHEHGGGVATAGSFVGLYGLGSMAGSYAGGWASDRIGPLATQKISLLLSGVGYLALPASSGTVAVPFVVFFAGLAGEAYRPAAMSSLAAAVPARARARGFGLLRQAANLGMAIGPTLGGLLASIDYLWLFVCDAGTCWLAAVLLHALLPREPAGAAAEAARRASSRAAGDRRSPWLDWPFLTLMLLVVVMVTAFFQLFAAVPLYLHEAYGLGERAIGLLFALNALLILLLELPLIRAVEQMRRLPLVGAGALLICAGLAVLPAGTSATVAVLSIVVWTLGEMLALPLLSVLVAERATESQLGRYVGIYTLSFSLAFVLAPLVGTQVYTRFGPDALWLTIGALGPVLLVWALVLRRYLPDGPPAEPSSPGRAAG